MLLCYSSPSWALSLAALWISEDISHCYKATSPQPCLNDDITSALWLCTKSPQLSSDPTWWLSCWLKVCHLRYWRCWLLAALPCLALFSCVSASSVCLVFGYVRAAFCSMSWRKITQPGSLEEPTCRGKTFVLCHCSSSSRASSFRFASLYCTWNSGTQTLCFALGMCLTWGVGE